MSILSVSNQNLEELLRYSDLPESLANKITEELDKLEGIKKELKLAERTIELQNEQLYFARELIDNIESGLNGVTSAKQAREWFVRAYENGQFER